MRLTREERKGEEAYATNVWRQIYFDYEFRRAIYAVCVNLRHALTRHRQEAKVNIKKSEASARAKERDTVCESFSIRGAIDPIRPKILHVLYLLTSRKKGRERQYIKFLAVTSNRMLALARKSSLEEIVHRTEY